MGPEHRSISTRNSATLLRSVRKAKSFEVVCTHIMSLTYFSPVTVIMYAYTRYQVHLGKKGQRQNKKGSQDRVFPYGFCVRGNNSKLAQPEYVFFFFVKLKNSSLELSFLGALLPKYVCSFSLLFFFSFSFYIENGRNNKHHPYKRLHLVRAPVPSKIAYSGGKRANNNSAK